MLDDGPVMHGWDDARWTLAMSTAAEFGFWPTFRMLLVILVGVSRGAASVATGEIA